MKVIFNTNIDKYKTNCFPTNLEIPPRIGETVLVTEVFSDFYNKQGLPLRMQVVDVNWINKGVICELWYKEIDVESCKLKGIELF
jgi:hypothetical protein